MEEINFIRPQEVFNRNTGESKVRYTSYDGSNKFIPVVDGEDGVPRTLVVTTHAELKAMRDAGKLTPGSLYRITDYQCTTTQENTRSAGHQFDIVLLALSENKLAEEGWAMMHDNIYDVTFSDGTKRKCYLYLFKNDEGEQYNIVYADTLIGYTGYIEDGDIVNIDEENKTASVNLIQDFEIENLTYNYFQNSNLSAWKVWYCLDNDKNRFAWADDSVNGEPLSVIVSGTFSGMYGEDIKCKRNPLKDATFEGVHYFNFDGNRPGPSVNIYTETLDINSETKWYGIGFNDNIPASKEELNDVVVSSVIPSTETPNGRGVIYRLVDDWNNDVPYDFKNIQFIRPMTNGKYDPEGEDTWVYTFNWNDHGIVVDATCYYYRGKISALYNIVNAGFALPNNVFFGGAKSCFVSLGSDTNTIINGYNVVLYNTFGLYDDGGYPVIYLKNKKVLTEDALNDIETALNNI